MASYTASQVLDKLEKAEASGNLDVSAMFTSLSQPRAASRLGGLGGASPPLFKGREHHQEITLRILSSHAGGLEVGLTEVELFTAEVPKRQKQAPVKIRPVDLFETFMCCGLPSQAYNAGMFGCWRT